MRCLSLWVEHGMPLPLGGIRTLRLGFLKKSHSLEDRAILLFPSSFHEGVCVGHASPLEEEMLWVAVSWGGSLLHPRGGMILPWRLETSWEYAAGEEKGSRRPL
jgi:hypothetical protein